jgi:presequence protease
VDVYLDAVFHPNCVRDPKTFAQEGWHYELESAEASVCMWDIGFADVCSAGLC